MLEKVSNTWKMILVFVKIQIPFIIYIMKRGIYQSYHGHKKLCEFKTIFHYFFHCMCHRYFSEKLKIKNICLKSPANMHKQYSLCGYI